MAEQPCDLVIEHQRILGEMASDIKHIKGKVDNGLSAKLEIVDKTLTKFMDSSAAQRRIDRAENWFSGLLQGSVKKIISYLTGFMIVSALATNGVWTLLKTYVWHESPGQQTTIVAQGKELERQGKETQQHSYHQHTLNDGRILFHTGDANMRAYILDPSTGKYERAPYMRTEDSVK